MSARMRHAAGRTPSATEGDYVEHVTRFLAGEYAVPETQVGGWRVKRIDRSSDTGIVTSSYTAGKPAGDRGGVRVQAPDVAGIAQLMAKWDAGEVLG